MAGDTCNWMEDGEDGPWQTSCGNYFTIIDGTPQDNDMRFCCYCGRPLLESPYTDSD